MKTKFTAENVGKTFYTSRSDRTVILLAVDGSDKRYSCICREVETGRTIRCTLTGMTGMISYKIYPHSPIEKVNDSKLNFSVDDIHLFLKWMNGMKWMYERLTGLEFPEPPKK